MKLLEFPEEVQNLYLEHCHIMNHYIETWVNTSMDLKVNKHAIHLSSYVLKSLSTLLEISSEHRPGYVKIDFDDYYEAITFRRISERIKFRLDSGISLEFNFEPTWFSSASIIPESIFDNIKLKDRAKSILSYHHHKIDYKDLDLSKLDVSIKNTSSESVVKELTFLWTQQRSYEELSPALDIVALIHTSLLELRDSKSVLDLSIAHYTSLYPMFDLIWSFIIIPDYLDLSYRRSSISDYPDPYAKNSIEDYKVFIPKFTMKLNILRD